MLFFSTKQRARPAMPSAHAFAMRIEQAFGKIKTVARKTEDQLPRP